ncbi:MAG: two-component regulator propeller domain-containing protein [Bacteroidota bacterium]
MILCFIFRIQALSSQARNDPYVVEKIPLTGELFGISGRSIFQDFHGFMWFGTNHGLFRHDGMEFKHFRHYTEDSTTISNDRILGMVEDRQGDLWIATRVGLNRYQTGTGKIIKYRKDPSIPVSIATGSLETIFRDHLDRIWIGKNNEFIKYTPDTDTFHSYRLAELQGPDAGIHRYWKMIMDLQGYLWVQYGDRKLCKFNTRTETADTVITGPSSLRDMIIDRRGRFWITSTEGLYLFNHKQYTFSRVLYRRDDPDRLHNQTVRAIHEDRSGNLWIRTFDGIYVYDCDLKLRFRKPHSEVYRYSFEDLYLTRPLFEDRSGTIWYYTRDAICKCYPKQHQFNAMTGFEPHYINSLCEDGNHNILFGSETVYLYNTRNKSQSNLIFNAPDHLSNQPRIQAMAYDKHNDILWIGSGNGGLYRIDHPADSMNDVKWYESDPISRLFLDKKGSIWIKNWNKLPILFDPVDERVWNLYSGPPGEEVLEQESCILHEYKNRTLLILGKGGLYRFHPPFKKAYGNKIVPGSISFLTDIHIDGDSLLGKKIASSLMDSRGSLWLGTRNWGMIRVDGAGDPGNEGFSFPQRRYTTSHGLPNNTICSLVEDHNGNIWIGTEFGLSRMNPDSHMFTNYTMLHGLPSNGFRANSSVRTSDNMLFFGTRGGVVYINPAISSGNQEIPQVLITGLKIHNRDVIPGKDRVMEKPVFLSDTLNLDHNQNHLSFEFSAMNYIQPHNNQYKYMLEGVDDDWVYCGHRNFTTYNDLGPGNYNFRVTGSNNDGLWNPEGKSIFIKIRPPWYRSIAALILWDLLFILAIAGIIRLRTRRLKMDKVRLEIEVENRINEIRWMNEQIIEMEAMKTRFFNNISHEFRNLISLIKIPVDCIWEEERFSKKCRVKLDVIRHNTNKLTKLVNQLLDISKIDKGKMKLELSRSNICDFVHAIAVSYSSLAETKGIQYRYIISPNHSMELYDEDKLEKIINNLLSNAFKFTDEGGKIILELKRKSKQNGLDEILEISVADTGSGIPREEHEKIFDRFYQAESTLVREGGGAGIGLALTYDLVELMHGTIDLESTVGKGSTFRVRIPLGTHHLNEREYSVIKRENPHYHEIELPDETPGSDTGQPGDHSREKSVPGNAPLVLIVEDNSEIRTMIADHLAPSFRVAEAINGSAGMKIATTSMPDLVITDLMMPGMDGFELCSRMKLDLRTSHIPVIMLTGKASLGDRLRGLESGADDYITKPFEMQEVEIRVKNLLEQRKKLKEKFSQTITLDSKDIMVSSLDQKFLRNVAEVVEREMSNEEFNVTGLCRNLHISRSTLSRKLNALTGLSSVEYIRACRMQRAALLLKQQFGNVSQVALEVGFSNPSYFTKMFRKSYEISPSSYAKTHN